MASHGLLGRHRKINRSSYVNGLSGMDEHHKRRRIFVLSAFHETIGEQQTSRLKSFVGSRTKHAENDFMEDLSYTLGECRTHHAWRRAITALATGELLNALETESVKFSKSKKAVRLGFVFTGQGAQWYAMGRELMGQYPIFLESLHKSQDYLTSMGAKWSLIGTIH
jgi:acyl transferase domain-containing protein